MNIKNNCMYLSYIICTHSFLILILRFHIWVNLNWRLFASFVKHYSTTLNFQRKFVNTFRTISNFYFWIAF